jgi:hypothetical protein
MNGPPGSTIPYCGNSILAHAKQIERRVVLAFVPRPDLSPEPTNFWRQRQSGRATWRASAGDEAVSLAKLTTQRNWWEVRRMLRA